MNKKLIFLCLFSSLSAMAMDFGMIFTGVDPDGISRFAIVDSSNRLPIEKAVNDLMRVRLSSDAARLAVNRKRIFNEICTRLEKSHKSLDDYKYVAYNCRDFASTGGVDPGSSGRSLLAVFILKKINSSRYVSLKDFCTEIEVDLAGALMELEEGHRYESVKFLHHYFMEKIKIDCEGLLNFTADEALSQLEIITKVHGFFALSEMPLSNEDSVELDRLKLLLLNKIT